MAHILTTTTPMRTKKTEISDAERQRAAYFARWQKDARDRKGMSIPQLADAIGYSESQVRLFDARGRAGIDHTEHYRQPKEEYIEAVARATGADKHEGLRIANLLRVNNVTGLPPEEESKLSALADLLPEDQIQLLRLYRGLPPQMRPSALDSVGTMKTAADIAREIQSADPTAIVTPRGKTLSPEKIGGGKPSVVPEVVKKQARHIMAEDESSSDVLC